jgi:hypothetical protein
VSGRRRHLYHPKRRHSADNGMSPSDFERSIANIRKASTIMIDVSRFEGIDKAKTRMP